MQKRKLEKTILEISILEQERIGKALHDTLAQNLTGAAMLLETLKRSLLKRTDENSVYQVEEILKIIRDSIAQARNFSTILTPLELESENFANALRDLTIQFSKIGNITCFFELNGEIHNLNSEITENVYKVIQEILNNSIKYTKATEIKVIVNSYKDKIDFFIKDNGIGYKISDKYEELGLKIINLRLRALGSNLKIESNDDSGTTISFVVSLP